MQTTDNNQKFDLEIRLNEHFDSIYSLCYSFIDLQAVVNSAAYITSHDEKEVKRIPSTVRSFGLKYKSELSLKSFSQGSFIASVGAGLVTAIIMKFLDRYFEASQVRQVHNHAHIHHHDARPLMQVRFEDADLEGRINRVLEKAAIVPGDIEQSLVNAIHAVNESRVLGQQQIVYSRSGLTVLAQDIERLGTTISVRA